MRIKLSFNLEYGVSLPVCQNYFLASAVYKTLESRPDYAQFLHDEGYVHQSSGRAFKLFVFSLLLCKKRLIAGQEIVLGPGQISWIISSPKTEFITALAEGLLSQGSINIRDEIIPISNVEVVPAPLFQGEMSFSCLSPIVIARPNPNGGYAHYCTHEDQDFSDRVRINLIRKYELIYGIPPVDDRFQMLFDPDYIARRDGKITKLINIRGTMLRGVMAPFTAQGSLDLIQVGYESGFGSYGSMGMGCALIRIFPLINNKP